MSNGASSVPFSSACRTLGAASLAEAGGGLLTAGQVMQADGRPGWGPGSRLHIHRAPGRHRPALGRPAASRGRAERRPSGGVSESSREEATWVLPVPSPCASPALSPFHLRREPSSFLSFLIFDPKLGLLLRLESADTLAVACCASHLRLGLARGLGGPFSSESLSCGLEQRVRCLEDKIVVWPWWGGLLGDP